MGIAMLTYTLNKYSNVAADELILMTGSLRSIDNCTRSYESIEAMRQGPEFQERINNFLKRNDNFIKNYNNGFEGEFTVSYVADTDNREYLPILFNDEVPIRVRSNSFDEVKSEVEKARKLLFKSKNKSFLRSLIKDERFADTTAVNIRLKLPEYRELVKKGFKPNLIDGQYYMTIHDILEYSLKLERYGLMRSLIEDALEVWKENILALDNDLLYYYSRHLRLAINNYNHSLVSKKTVVNLKPNVENLVEANSYGKSKLTYKSITGVLNKGIKMKKIEESFS